MDIKIEDKSPAVITRAGQILAYVETALKTGQACSCAYDSGEDRINANRDVNLVNAMTNCKISRAKKHLKDEYRWHVGDVVEINEGEFLFFNSIDRFFCPED